MGVVTVVCYCDIVLPAAFPPSSPPPHQQVMIVMRDANTDKDEDKEDDRPKEACSILTHMDTHTSNDDQHQNVKQSHQLKKTTILFQSILTEKYLLDHNKGHFQLKHQLGIWISLVFIDSFNWIKISHKFDTGLI